jgi:hypothetical protein
MKLKVWVEVFTTQRFTEDLVEVPDEQWAAMSDAERAQYKQTAYEAMLIDIANGGCEEVEE